MAKPDPQQVEHALAAAERLREGKDNTFLGHYTLYLHERNAHLEEVYAAVQKYIHSGQASHEHAVLLRAMEKTERAANPHADAPAIFPDS